MRMRMIHKHFPNVKRIIDATRPITIKVTDKDCKAVEKSPTDCAIARAARNNLHCQGAIILPSTTYLIKRNTALRFRNAPSTQTEIAVFDRNGGFKPGLYRLSVPPKRSHERKPRKSGPGLTRRKVAIHRTENIRTILDV